MSAMNAKRVGIVPTKGVTAFAPYAVPRLATPVDLFLDGNEGAVPPVALLARLSRQGPDLMRRYPDARVLEEILAGRLGVAPDRVIVTAGADDAIDRICRTVLAPGREMVLPIPTFEMFARYAGLAGAAVRTVPWLTGAYPLNAVLAAAGPRTAMVPVVSPNNPTGAVARPSDIERLSRNLPGALIVADLAYAEFAEEDLTAAALSRPNVVVVRSLSKAWGMAGLRVGYAAGPADLVGWLRSAGAPYAVSRVSLALAAGRLAMPGADRDVGRFVARVARERTALARAIREGGGKPFPSQANFVMARFARPDAESVRAGLAGLGIAVRSFPGKAELEGCLRITCPGTEKGFRRLMDGMRTVLAPQALLLDMDGVLADVSASYREAIRWTAASYGVSVGRAEISAAKKEPGSNNDWEVTRRLVARRGVRTTLAEVTRRFEDLYQGKEGRAGFRERERLIPARGLLARLARRIKLGVVTGRPRADAARFLAEAGIDRLVGTCVCLEDAPLKPDPAPVRLAMRRLGVSRAWYLGDTPDDMRAARGAGVVPVGFLAPGEERKAAESALARAGAGRVVETFEELEGMLP